MDHVSRLTVRKMNMAGDTDLTWSGEVLGCSSSCVKLEARFDRYDRHDLGYVVLERGDRFVEWFFTDCWYTIYEIHARRNDQLKGWYCNITRPAEVIGSEVHTVDLELDLWVGPDRSMLVLDKQEFEELALLDVDRNAACAALEELRHMVVSGNPPFDQFGKVFLQP